MNEMTPFDSMRRVCITGTVELRDKRRENYTHPETVMTLMEARQLPGINAETKAWLLEKDKKGLLEVAADFDAKHDIADVINEIAAMSMSPSKPIDWASLDRK